MLSERLGPHGVMTFIIWTVQELANPLHPLLLAFQAPAEVALVSMGTVRKHHRWGDLNNRNVLPHSPGGWELQIKVPAVSVPGEASLPGL